MRIKLEKGKQKKLILLAKSNGTWKDLAQFTGIKESYLLRDLKYEKILLTEEKYKVLCEKAKINFDEFILDRLNENWGRSIGGIKSLGSTIKVVYKRNDLLLSEFIGAILGDGNINFYKNGKKVGTYQVKIAGDLEKDKDYHLNYLKPLIESIFNLEARALISKHERFLVISSKELITFLISKGLKSGDKIKNQITIPSWIKRNKKYLMSCLRGLMDTDGCIYQMSQRDSNLLRLNFCNYNRTLLFDVKKAFEDLEFFVTINKDKNEIFISRQKDVEKYINEIGFSNQKHLNRLQKFRNSPLV